MAEFFLSGENSSGYLLVLPPRPNVNLYYDNYDWNKFYFIHKKLSSENVLNLAITDYQREQINKSDRKDETYWDVAEYAG